MTKGKLITLGALAGAVILAVFGFGIYGIISCSSKLFIERRINDSQNDEYYNSVVATVIYLENERGYQVVRLEYAKGNYHATILPETKKFLQDNEIELEPGESYTFTVFTMGEPTVHYPIAAIASEDGEEVYLSYLDGKQFITDYLVSMRG